MRTLGTMLLLTSWVIVGCHRSHPVLTLPAPYIGDREVRHNHAGAAGLRLALSLDSSEERAEALQITLANGSLRTLAIQTGIKLGSREYPGAKFIFQLEIGGQGALELGCSGCQPALIAGDVEPFTIWLNPSEHQTFDVPLSLLRIPQGATEKPLNVIMLHGAHLAVILRGQAVANETEPWLGETTGHLDL